MDKIISRSSLFSAAVIVLFVVSTVSDTADARQFRRITPISTQPRVLDPTSDVSDMEVAVPSSLPTQAEPVAQLTPIDDSVIVDAIEDIVANWNTSGLADYLDAYFPSRTRLLNVIQNDIPHDAELQLLNVQSISTLSQNWVPNSGYMSRSRVSSVVATVSLQIRFVDAFRGQVTLPHTSQFYLRVLESE